MIRFTGQSEHSMDNKGRLVLPSRLRGSFESVGGNLVMGTEGCLALWPHDLYLEQLDKLDAKVEAGEEDRSVLRIFAAGEHVVPDGQGRILVNSRLQEYAGLRREKVLVVGANRIVEIWDPERWEQVVDGPAVERLKGSR